MPSVRIIQEQDTKIVYNDMAFAKPEEAIACCQDSQRIIGSFPEGSALVLVDVSGMRFNRDVIQVVKETTRKNKPYVKTTAVFGLEGFTKILINSVISFSGRDMKLFKNKEEALNWLLERAALAEVA